MPRIVCCAKCQSPTEGAPEFSFLGRFLSFLFLPFMQVYTGNGRFELPWASTESQKRPGPTKRQKEPGCSVFSWAFFNKWAQNIPASVGSKRVFDDLLIPTFFPFPWCFGRTRWWSKAWLCLWQNNSDAKTHSFWYQGRLFSGMCPACSTFFSVQRASSFGSR